MQEPEEVGTAYGRGCSKTPQLDPRYHPDDNSPQLLPRTMMGALWQRIGFCVDFEETLKRLYCSYSFDLSELVFKSQCK